MWRYHRWRQHSSSCSRKRVCAITASSSDLNQSLSFFLDVWSLDELIAAVGNVDRSSAVKALSTWANKGVIKEQGENSFVLLERAEEGASDEDGLLSEEAGSYFHQSMILSLMTEAIFVKPHQLYLRSLLCRLLNSSRQSRCGFIGRY